MGIDGSAGGGNDGTGGYSGGSGFAGFDPMGDFMGALARGGYRGTGVLGALVGSDPISGYNSGGGGYGGRGAGADPILGAGMYDDFTGSSPALGIVAALADMARRQKGYDPLGRGNAVDPGMEDPLGTAREQALAAMGALGALKALAKGVSGFAGSGGLIGTVKGLLDKSSEKTPRTGFDMADTIISALSSLIGVPGPFSGAMHGVVNLGREQDQGARQILADAGYSDDAIDVMMTRDRSRQIAAFADAPGSTGDVNDILGQLMATIQAPPPATAAPAPPGQGLLSRLTGTAGRLL